MEARLLATGAKDSRRRDLLQLQASAHNDLRQALNSDTLSGSLVSASAAVRGVERDGGGVGVGGLYDSHVLDGTMDSIGDVFLAGDGGVGVGVGVVDGGEK